MTDIAEQITALMHEMTELQRRNDAQAQTIRSQRKKLEAAEELLNGRPTSADMLRIEAKLDLLLAERGPPVKGVL
jgi:predicted  nucleic acid-binding Zn-ribbon protein